MKLFAAISRFIHRRRAQISAAPAPFDDGLVDIARLIEVDDPPDLAPHPAADTIEPLQQTPPAGASKLAQWRQWQNEAEAIWKNHPNLSRHSVARLVKRRLHVSEQADSIARRIHK